MISASGGVALGIVACSGFVCVCGAGGSEHGGPCDDGGVGVQDMGAKG